MADEKRPSPSFFTREQDGSVRLRLRFTAEEAALIEEAAGQTPVVTWVKQTLRAAAHRRIQRAREGRPDVGPPQRTDNDSAQRPHQEDL